MRKLLRVAVSAAIAGALVHGLLRRRAGRAPGAASGDMIADTNMVHGGDPGAEQRGPQPQDWRGAQNVSES